MATVEAIYICPQHSRTDAASVPESGALQVWTSCSVCGSGDLGSAGDRFLEGLVNVQYGKRLKRRLQETAEHYTERADRAGTREGHVIDGEVEQLQRLARLVLERLSGSQGTGAGNQRGYSLVLP